MRLGRAKLPILLASGLLAGIAATGGVSASAEQPTAKIPLALGGSRFWDGPYVDRARVPDSSLCGASGPCWSYELDVAPGSPRLRVAIGTTDPSNDYTLELLNPEGKVVTSGSNGDVISAHYATELFATNPEAGAWTMRVVPENVVAGTFRARAKLETSGAPATSSGQVAGKAKKCKHRKHRKYTKRAKRKGCKHKRRKHRASNRAADAAGVTQLLPNLKVDPPWDIGFRPPLPAFPPGPIHMSSLLNEMGIHNADAELGGLNPSSCTWDETAESTLDTHCLRFSTGIPNFGAGPFTIRGTMDPTDPNGHGLLEGPLDQRIYNSDGTYTDVPAGHYVFHKIHFHFHVTNLAEFRLFRVNDGGLTSDGPMTEVGKGLKEGFCLVNVKMATFTEFIQGVPHPEGNCLPQPDSDTFSFTEEITKGWEDVYDWETPGQYIDFGSNPDGLYVIQMKINTAGLFHESRTDDNVAYTLIRVTGNQVQTLERGRGESPFDPNKTVLDPVMTW